jgi:lipopolysaccharide export system protein LptA
MILALQISADLNPTEALAATQERSSLPPLFYDAETSHFDRFGKQQIFEGNVVIMIGNNLVSADTLSLDREKEIFHAKGHVLVVSAHEVIGGDELEYSVRTEDFLIINAFIITEDPKRGDEISHKILGITPEEIRFEADKTQQIGRLKEKKETLKKRYKYLAPSQKPLMVEEYAVLLEKEDLISKQKNPALAQLSAHKREAIEKRREFWDQSRKNQLPVSKSFLAKTYTRLKGSWIKRTEGNRYRARDMSLTPCLCDDDETPAWQIRADTIDSYAEGYADLEEAVIEVKGVPILYLPFLRIPMKGERQSGFLFPSLSYNRLNGSIFTQPVFFNLGSNKDATMTVDMIERRGTRLGGEFRYQQKTYSGWELQGEVIRDQQWVALQAERAEIDRSYRDGLSRAIATTQNTPPPPERRSSYAVPILSEPDFWNKDFGYCLQHPESALCEDILSLHLKAPKNTFRYKAEWKGMNFITPRVSFVSEGKFLSDHRYLQDLYFDKFNESFNPTSPDLFAKAKGHLHLDGNDLYVGLGSNWGDNLRFNSRFSGHQLPFSLRVRTRSFPVFEGVKPVYATLLLNYKKISFIEDTAFRKEQLETSLKLRLDSGHWSQFKLNLLSPLITDQIFVLNAFTELEARAIDTGYVFADTAMPLLESRQEVRPGTMMQTMRLGLDLKLPIDGTIRLSPTEVQKSEGIKYLNHRMNWGLTYSVRPSVVKRGPYGELVSLYAYDAASGLFKANEGANSQRLTYFGSDSPQNYDSDFIPEQERMIPHHQVTLSTSHDWKTYKKTWSFKNTNNLIQDPVKTPITFADKALNELEYTRHLMDLLDANLTERSAQKKGFELTESDSYNFAHFDGNISYDFRKESERRKHREDPSLFNSTVLNPWSPARLNTSFNAYDWTLSNSTKYDVYLKTATELHFQLSPPTVLSTRFSLGFTIEKEVDVGSTGVSQNRTLTRSIGFTTSVIPYVSLLGEYDVRTKENQSPEKFYYASAGATYLSPTNCWGIQFWWKKDYPEPTWAGTYYLSLNIKFFNYERQYGNLMSKANKT